MRTIAETCESGGPFEIGETLSIYEAAMIYAGRHPGGRFLDGKVKDFVLDAAGKKTLDGEGLPKTEAVDYGRGALREYETYLGRNAKEGPRKLSWDIYCELKKRIDHEAMKPIRTAYLPSGEIDPRDTIIRTADLAKLAQERNERPEFLAHLMQSPETRTGFAGRPQMPIALILGELDARAQRGDTCSSLAGEARALVKWLASNHPTLTQPKPESVANSIRELYRDKHSSPSPTK